MGYSKLKIPKTCEYCNKTFEAKTVTTRFCSSSCIKKSIKERKKAEKKEVERQTLVAKISDTRPFITVAEAVLLFGISRDTIYRLIRTGKLPAVNLGERLTRISRTHIETMFAPLETEPQTAEVSFPKMDFSQDECYTIGEITEKFGVSPTTVFMTIRRNSVPKKQVGKFVYVPKDAIDRIFANKK